MIRLISNRELLIFYFRVTPNIFLLELQPILVLCIVTEVEALLLVILLGLNLLGSFTECKYEL